MNEQRVARLEREVQQIRQTLNQQVQVARPHPGKNYRLARCETVGGSYPTTGQQFRITFINMEFPDATGDQTPTIEDRSDENPVCRNLAGSLPPESTILIAWEWRSQWFTFYLATASSPQILIAGDDKLNDPLVPGGSLSDAQVYYSNMTFSDPQLYSEEVLPTESPRRFFIKSTVSQGYFFHINAKYEPLSQGTSDSAYVTLAISAPTYSQSGSRFFPTEMRDITDAKQSVSLAGYVALSPTTGMHLRHQCHTNSGAAVTLQIVSLSGWFLPVSLP